MKELNNKLDGLSELVTRIDAKILDINTKLDELIKALHDYDGNDEYGESSFEAFMDIQDDITSWKVDGAERRVDIIGQNERSHYVTNEEADDDARSNNNSDKHTGETKKRYKRYYKPKVK